MNPAVFFGIAAPVLIIWGMVCAVFNEWAARLFKRTQRIYGRRATDQITPRYVRFIGIMLAVGGVVFIVLIVAGWIPNRPA